MVTEKEGASSHKQSALCTTEKETTINAAFRPEENSGLLGQSYGASQSFSRRVSRACRPGRPNHFLLFQASREGTDCKVKPGDEEEMPYQKDAERGSRKIVPEHIEDNTG
ncbi:hypothetical protein MRX96_025380 [Rhipicephalus microplus]